MNSPSRYHSMIGVGDPSAEHCKVTGSWRATVTSEGCSVIRGGLPTTPTITNKTKIELFEYELNGNGICISRLRHTNSIDSTEKRVERGEDVSLSIGDLDCADTYLLSFSFSLCVGFVCQVKYSAEGGGHKREEIATYQQGKHGGHTHTHTQSKRDLNRLDRRTLWIYISKLISYTALFIVLSPLCWKTADYDS